MDIDRSAQFTIGNCVEQANAAFSWLLVNIPDANAMVVYIEGGDHVFVVVGPDDVDITDKKNWEKNDSKIFIIDPWKPDFYAAKYHDLFLRDHEKLQFYPRRYEQFIKPYLCQHGVNLSPKIESDIMINGKHAPCKPYLLNIDKKVNWQQQKIKPIILFGKTPVASKYFRSFNNIQDKEALLENYQEKWSLIKTIAENVLNTSDHCKNDRELNALITTLNEHLAYFQNAYKKDNMTYVGLLMNMKESLNSTCLIHLSNIISCHLHEFKSLHNSPEFVNNKLTSQAMITKDLALLLYQIVNEKDQMRIQSFFPSSNNKKIVTDDNNELKINNPLPDEENSSLNSAYEKSTSNITIHNHPYAFHYSNSYSNSEKKEEDPVINKATSHYSKGRDAH